MVKDADYYELHRKLFKEALVKAQEDINQRPIERERTLSLERAKNEAEARELVAKHKAKVAKIQIERPYLQSQEINDILLQNQRIFDQNPDEHPVDVTLSNTKYRNDGFNETYKAEEDHLQNNLLQSIISGDQEFYLSEMHSPKQVQPVIEMLQDQARLIDQATFKEDIKPMIGGGVSGVLN